MIRFRKGGLPRHYSFWAADSLYARYLVDGNLDILKKLFPDLIENFKGWEIERLDENGLFWQVDGYDGMEYSIGGSGCRPSINSYMFGEAAAIAKIAELLGETETAASFLEKSNQIKQQVQNLLWDSDSQFFKTLPSDQANKRHKELFSTSNPYALQPQNLARKRVDVCELIGYLPWYFNMPDRGYEAAWNRLMDNQGFYAPFGPTTSEQKHPGFLKELPQKPCLWNGPSWPYATTQVLTAMANLLHYYEPTQVDQNDYFEMLNIYTKSQYIKNEDGQTVPWIDESLHPYTGEWLTRKILHQIHHPNRNRGKDYNHSGYNDLIISGLIGLKPGAQDVLDIHPLLPRGKWDYFCLEDVLCHQHRITLMYDQTGMRYNQGKGFKVWIDGREAAHTEELSKIKISLNNVK